MATAIREFAKEAARVRSTLVDQAISRALGAPLVTGNRVRLLRDATENYPAWLEAIRSARRSVLFENYFVHADGIGHTFAQALAEKAREGVRVRLIRDWMGSLGRASERFWVPLREAGAEVRCFNPLRLTRPLESVRRDHRKMLCVDGELGFVTGLCVGNPWAGDSARGIEPWRDTGLMIQGPAAAHLTSAFAEMWGLAGHAAPNTDDFWQHTRPTSRVAGGVALRVVATAPNTGRLYRFDQLIAGLAKRSIWLTDAYFLGTAPYVHALSAAAADGVDVRLLLPRSGDLPIVRTLSRVGYRTLLEGGVRIFEWNGPMLHAKTAVADGRWSRIGSTNLNPASWIGNWELDVVVEDEAFGEEMEEMYLKDLANATEIVLDEKKVRPARPAPRRMRRGQGSTRRAVAGLLKVGNTVEAVVSQRPLGRAEVLAMASAAVVLLLTALICFLWPAVVIAAMIGVTFWIAVSLFASVAGLYWRTRKHKAKAQNSPL